MIGCGFFGDEQPTNRPADESPRWVSISELSALLDVSRNTISTATKRAWANSEPWVKKEKTEDENTLYLIDTQHEMYRFHEEQWKQQKALRAALLEESAPALSQAYHSLFPSLSSGRSMLLYYATLLSEDWLQRWPHFRQWLYSQGIQVFQNLLAEKRQKRSWEWRWKELHGEGCESCEKAIIAALQSRFEAYEAERKEQEDTAFFRTLEQQELQKSQPRRFWFRRNGSHRFL